MIAKVRLRATSGERCVTPRNVSRRFPGEGSLGDAPSGRPSPVACGTSWQAEPKEGVCEPSIVRCPSHRSPLARRGGACEGASAEVDVRGDDLGDAPGG